VGFSTTSQIYSSSSDQRKQRDGFGRKVTLQYKDQKHFSKQKSGEVLLINERKSKENQKFRQ